MMFQPWPKTPRLFRNSTITEKIDGTNAAVFIDPEPLLADWEDGQVLGTAVVVSIEDQKHALYAQSRKRLITPEDDNHGFARWVFDNAQPLADVLGPGRHFGEWWGKGVQRGYGVDQKFFSLFNTSKWSHLLSHHEGESWAQARSAGLRTVPVIYEGLFSEYAVESALQDLATEGSYASPGFMKPEGVVVYHHAANQVFKVTLENDEEPKSASRS